MQGADTGHAIDLDGHGVVVGIVRARFNDAITARMADTCRAELARLGVQPKHVTLITVPGALEVPIALKALARADDKARDAAQVAVEMANLMDELL